MADDVATLNSLVGEIVDLRSAASLLDWDAAVCMPPGGVGVYGNNSATIRRLAHDRFTSTQLGECLERALRQIESLPPDAELSRLVKVTARDYDRAVRVPAEYIAEQAMATSTAYQAWKEARERSDFAIFLPHLEKIIALKQQYVGFFQPLDHPYDAVLEDYEPGFRTSDIETMFGALRERQVDLARTIQNHPRSEDAFLRASYDEQVMVNFAREVISTFGFDWSRGRQDKSAHPFATPIGTDDVRITTRFDERNPFETLFSTMHEAGHALYEQGVAPVWERTVVRGGASLGVHESQSRLWENLIGRSLPFWEHFFPLLRRRFPSQLQGVSLEAFYHAINRVKSSFIRVEADEVTYNLHVMPRVEIEIALLTKAIAAKDAPDFWNAKMKEYLGIVPDSPTHGILQDMHWSIGLFGYFATYTVGNLISVQLWEKFTAERPDSSEMIRRGEFAPIREWLRTVLHRHGRSYQPRELVENITGSAISTKPYLDYLSIKYGALCGLPAGG
jgi:carboxypeptidase Taq